MSERIALLAGSIEKRKRLRMGMQERGNRNPRLRLRTPARLPKNALLLLLFTHRRVLPAAHRVQSVQRVLAKFSRGVICPRINTLLIGFGGSRRNDVSHFVAFLLGINR